MAHAFIRFLPALLLTLSLLAGQIGTAVGGNAAQQRTDRFHDVLRWSKWAALSAQNDEAVRAATVKDVGSGSDDAFLVPEAPAAIPAERLRSVPVASPAFRFGAGTAAYRSRAPPSRLSLIA